MDYLEEIGSELFPFVVGQKKVEEHQEAFNTSFEKLKKELEFWNNVLQSSTFLVGDHITAADLGLYVLLGWWSRYDVTFNEFPKYYPCNLFTYFYGRLKEWKERIDQRDSAKNTIPPHWKDSKPTFSLAGKL
jgi:glutathione S-transferase